ncbi:ABC transporter substrate-binding protein [Spongiactinospora sp. TRM90649]|uniref:ABC transporter substrate-binding protein n=1 Tax=Spongiactinospora sp. TRM90649 TaxID=3031114 RepID=UPI0023F78E12|nr:ABC transporter substrate-binding protein [Spongiactinospora sp. TRM90649]MDF5751599.1 ABC transporter substrate-binding protein [Spongiactinospora sp. TRM90649]
MGVNGPSRSLADTGADMVRRPRLRDRFLPFVLFEGENSTSMALDFAKPARGHAPFAEIHGDTSGFKVIDLLDHAAAAMGRRVPWSLLPPPRFPLFQFVLWALREGAEAGSAERLSAQAVAMRLNQPLRAWLRGGGPSWRSPLDRAEYITRFLALPTVVTSAVSTVITTVYDVAAWAAAAIWGVAILFACLFATLGAANWSSGHYRYRWFASQPFLTRANEGLADYAGRIAFHTGPDHEAVVERLLVAAFYEDLRVAYRRLRPWVLWPGWGRSTHAVLLLEDARPGTACHRLLTVMHDVLVATGRRVPLLVIAGEADPPADSASHRHAGATTATSPDLLDASYAGWRSAAERPAPCPYFFVRAGDGKHLGGGEGTRRVDRRGRALAYRVSVLLAVALPVYLGGRALLPPACASDLAQIDRQCVGVTSTVVNFDPFLAPLLGQIDRQNKAIPSEARSFTVVYLGPLTREPGRGDTSPLVGTAGELVGIAARQEGYNRLEGPARMRVEFANTGQDYRYAEIVARDLKERAATDESMAAVIGLGWSRAEVRNAIAVLGSAQLPMVGTTSTADNLAMIEGGPSAWFFRLAAANSRQARATVEWITKLGVPEGGGGRRFHGEDVSVLAQKEPNELYSQDLAEWFTRMLPGTSMREFGDGTQLAQAVKESCEAGSTLLYFTGRSSLLTTLRDAWAGHCAEKKVVVMASDDVTRTVANDIRRGETDLGLQLRFASLTDPRDSSGASGGRPEHQKAVEGWVRRATAAKIILPGYSMSHAGLGYDAALVVTEALGKFLAKGGGTHVRTGIHYYLRGLHVVGATGEITFSSDAAGHDALDRKVWLVGVEKDKGFSAHYVCTPTDVKAACAPPKESSARE